MSKHTPGAWVDCGTPVQNKKELTEIFNESIEAHTGDVGPYFMEVCTADWRRVAFLAGPTAVANARLIAAAPDLLEALILARSMLEESEQCYENQMFRNAQIDAALAKAKGE